MPEIKRPLHVIAAEIKQSWGARVNYAAKPYLDVMHQLNGIDDSYGHDSGKGIVLRFLSNSSTWRGEDARRLKNELKSLVK